MQSTAQVISTLLLATLQITKSEQKLDWWKSATFYQIYPRSFKDSNNDGIGDLQGIIEKMDHFTNAGVDAIWLSPIFKSPQIDQGYDISNYVEIDPDYGTINDFEKLVQKAHSQNIKVILDFVPNHSSDQHEWFKASAEGVGGYKDYYVWADARFDEDGTKSPPNNWISVFKNSAWTWNNKRKQYYLHQFAAAQPDLNFRNPKVIEEMNEILKFWLDKGVDGFRIDAVPHIFEHEALPDEPLADTEEELKPTDYGYLDHIYTQNQPETYNLIYSWRKFVDDYTKTNGGDQRILMTEAYADINNTMLYYGSPDGKLGAHFTFNFNLITDIHIKSTSKDIVKAIKKWLDNIPHNCTSNWVLGNHDSHRVATRLGPENVDGYNMLKAVLPGVDITYNGEEIGQEDGEVRFEEGQDPSARDPKIFDKVSRDFERTPYQWDNSIHAGFNEAARTWLPVSKEYLKTNLKQQLEVEGTSHFKIYQALGKLRKDPVLVYGSVEIKAVDSGDDVILLKRSFQGNSVVLIFNKGQEGYRVNVKDDVCADNKVILKSTQSIRSLSSVDPKDLRLKPHEAIILRFVKN